jgi:hypothetical protein
MGCKTRAQQLPQMQLRLEALKVCEEVVQGLSSIRSDSTEGATHTGCACSLWSQSKNGRLKQHWAYFA